MPRPPNIGWLGELNFITNYFLAGCDVEPWLFIECAQPAALDILKLFFLPDIQDIGQEIFDPKGKRRRRPGRHGRKKRRPPEIPDPSQIVGQKVRGILNPYNALNYKPFNYAFRILNQFERVNFTVAVVEGLTDVGFEGLVGMIEVNHDLCVGMPRMRRSRGGVFNAGGAGPEQWPIPIPDLHLEENFNSTNHYCQAHYGSYNVYLRMKIKNFNQISGAICQISLGNGAGAPLKWSSEVHLGPNEEVELFVDHEYEPHTSATWGVRHRTNFPTVIEAEVMAFATAQIPWPI